MKLLKYVAFTLLGLIALFLLGAAISTKEMKYEQSIIIDTPVDKVWVNVNSLQAIDKWSPWKEKDPQMKQTFEGTPGSLGSSVSWQSDSPDVGNGKQSLSALETNKHVKTELKFYGDYESEAVAYVNLEDQGEKTKVTWGFESEMPYPFNAMMWLVDTEDMLGKDYRKGLEKLKDLSEKG